MAKKKTFTRVPHIDDATLDKIIAKLEELREESLRVVDAQRTADSSTQRDDTDVGDDMDKASHDRDREFNLLMHERHLRRLRQIEEAYERVQEGTYGLCEGTEEPINPKRLMIMPLARYSLEFQQEQEKMLGRTPDDAHFNDESGFEVDDED